MAGWFLSRMSFIGRIGINLMHKEYKFLKVWYQGAGVVFGIFIILFLLQLLVQRRLSFTTARLVHVIALIVAAVGLYFTYNDFRTDFAHGLMKERFHLGAYLFWIGWMAISLFFLSERRVMVAKPNMPSKL